PIGRVAVAGHESGALQAVQHAGHGRRMQARPAGERGRAQRSVPVHDLHAVPVDVLDLQASPDPAVEQRPLNVQLPQRALDRDRKAPPTPRFYGTHIVLTQNYTTMVLVSYWIRRRTS